MLLYRMDVMFIQVTILYNFARPLYIPVIRMTRQMGKAVIAKS